MEDVSEDVAREIQRRADRAREDLPSSIEAFVESYAGLDWHLTLRLRVAMEKGMALDDLSLLQIAIRVAFALGLTACVGLGVDEHSIRTPSDFRVNN